MNEMLNYVFNSMKTSEAAITKLEKALRKQMRSNRRLKLLAAAGIAYVAWAESTRWEQQEKIDELSREVEELKHKGE